MTEKRWGDLGWSSAAGGRQLRRSPDADSGVFVVGDPVPGYAGSGRLNGQRALVVGGVMDGAGSGRIAAVALAKEGAAVAVADRTGRAGLPGAWPLDHQGQQDALLATTRLLGAIGARTLAIHCDLDTEGGCREAVAHTALEFGAIDTLVVCANAAAERDGPVDSTAWLVQAARVFMVAGASVIVPAPEPRAGSPGPGPAAATAGAAPLPAPLAAALRERRIRVGGVAAEHADAAAVAAEYVSLASAERVRV
ncbi:NAD(P)-dependent dehydrogenase (short-subunit alcohol dehydrogenase family) [Lipingzhangella halophila]|uniref:NAD(P)-dependent dehydrogenase (Short-subunit alcohol dehydrogenase family) n=1 Tax=Lipingzhangella halophila TaxID=1783352 RepID=A0A7W7RCI2_9ACTN|nr:hypothetical protein [Lipingzhangella halophila]MBB4929467.1 NAD(P)-dependent dehydrogenase (short-subunit alcohol dehydrogenase family) [Lipingzhangella halophila]